MKPVSGMQGMRSQEIVVWDKERKEERKGKKRERANVRQQKEEQDDRKDSENKTWKEKNKRKNGMAQQGFHTRKVWGLLQQKGWEIYKSEERQNLK